MARYGYSWVSDRVRVMVSVKIRGANSDWNTGLTRGRAGPEGVAVVSRIHMSSTAPSRLSLNSGSFWRRL